MCDKERNRGQAKRQGAGVLAVLGLSLILGGCSPYALRGVVVQGAEPAMVVVGKNDPRLKQAVASGASVEVTLEPQSMSPRRLGGDVSNEAGEFEVLVDEPGAGFLEYDAGILCRLSGYRSVWQIMRLPLSGKRLLIVMSPGPDTYKAEPDLIDETMRLGGFKRN